MILNKINFSFSDIGNGPELNTSLTIQQSIKDF
jgi:hypothetical protein